MRGLYVSYKENQKCCSVHNIKNGSIDDLIRISKKEYLIFENKKACKGNLRFPTKVLITTVPKKRFGKYYKGNLLLVMNYSDVNSKILEDPKHRPMPWIEMCQKCEKVKAKSVFFISNLESIPEPPNLKGKNPPQTFTYINFD